MFAGNFSAVAPSLSIVERWFREFANGNFVLQITFMYHECYLILLLG